jgi:ketosteroid isomerase-like protein
VANTDELLRRLVAAFLERDRAALRKLLADDLVAYITNADAGADRVDGNDAYIDRLLSLQAPTLSIEVTQAVMVAPDQALAMVEIRAEREERTLHNFAAFLGRERDGRIVELWMVDAKPAYSDEFWQ